MNMCDDPTHVSIGEVWRENAMNIRVPVIVTGNDFSTLFAPLIRDGRMDKCAPRLLCSGPVPWGATAALPRAQLSQVLAIVWTAHCE